MANDNVIQLFPQGQPEPEPSGNGEPLSWHELLTEELDSSLLDVQNRIAELYESTSVDEFRGGLRSIKQEVAGWPE